MTDDPIDPEVLSEICDRVDEYPDALSVVLPRDRARFAELTSDRNVVEHSGLLLLVDADADEAIEQLLPAVTAAGLEYSVLALRDRPAQRLIGIGVHDVRNPGVRAG